MEKEEVIKEQDRIIGELTRKVNYLEDSESKRNEWLRDAKKKAGYNDKISFDVVFADLLKLKQDSELNPLIKLSEAFEFAEWISTSYWERKVGDRYWYDGNERETTESLYQLFLDKDK